MTHESQEETVVGIDLGTTNSLVGAVVDGQAVLFTDATGAELLPSVVGADPEGRLVVGRAAKNRRLLDPEGTIVSVKRRMGTRDRVRLAGRELTPPEVSALILGSLLDRAEGKLGRRPSRAVITVPAYFDDAQRQATRDAGQLAGLTVERLVNEPTAAALTYRSGEEQVVLVYDLGGGTFDVSVLDRDEGLLEVRASHGDTHLGGDDVDRALVDFVLGRVGDARESIEADPRALTRLVEAVERAKIALSDRKEARLVEPFLAGEGAGAVHLDLVLTQDEVSQVVRPFVERTLARIDAALRDARVRPGDLDRVLLVGGASKMPVVRTMVSAHLGRPAQVDPDAERAVALGASMLAGRLSGAEIDEVLVDVTPHTLSIGVLLPDDHVHDEGDLAAEPVIPRGTVVPVERHRTVATRVDGQEAAAIPVTQGEGLRVGDNTRLGRVVIEDLPPSAAGSPVDVVFRLDLSGVLDVSAVHLASGRSASVRIVDSPYGLTAHRREAARARVEELRASSEEPRAGGAVAATESELSLARAMLSRAERVLERASQREDVEAEAGARVRQAREALEQAVAARSADVPERTDALSDALLDLV